MSHVKSARKLQAEAIIKNLEKRNMTAFYCEDIEECRQKVLELVPADSVISWGGSMSIHECGVPQALKDRGDCEVLDRSRYITPEQQQEFAVKTFQSDYYLMSTNAITLDGELVNIDGNGNRVASLIYGPKHVIVITGMNKVVPDVKQGFDRVRNIASPPNTIRLGKNTPCAQTGKCGDCMSPECICNQIVVTRRSREKERIIVILVNENLGF
jgi:hypothetical protein